MKRNNNQWAKYVAVVLTFMIMAGFFLLGAKAEVKATEGTESAEMEGESNGPVPLASWSVSISFDTNGGGFSEEVKKAYFPDGGMVYRTETTESGADTSIYVSIPSEFKPTREGHSFSGWLCNIDNVVYQPGNENEYRYSQGNITYTAQWTELKKVTIKYDPNGGTYDNILEIPYTQAEGETEFTVKISSDIIPQMEENTFSGWLCEWDNILYTEGDKALVFQWDKMTTGQTITFIAQWTPIPTVTVTFDGNGGECYIEPYVLTKEETDTFMVNVSDPPIKQGYYFNGWQCNMPSDVYQIAEDGSSYIFLWEKFPSGGEITFTAQWEWDGKSILANDTFILNPGTAYTLSEGNWIVSKDGESDGYSYISSDNEMPIYVGTEGNYTFTKN